jgi:hypothetical protein
LGFDRTEAKGEFPGKSNFQHDLLFLRSKNATSTVRPYQPFTPQAAFQSETERGANKALNARCWHFVDITTGKADTAGGPRMSVDG